MKAQELRDKLAAIRNFDVLVDGNDIEEVIIDIANSKVYIESKKKPNESESELDKLIRVATKKEGDK